MKRFLGLALATLSLAAIPTAHAEDRITVTLPAGGLMIAQSPVGIECKNPGSSQDVAKTPSLKNTTTAAIKSGTTLFWKASDGDQGAYKLTTDLAPGASVKMMGKPGQVYTCTSNFYSAPDLVVRRAALGSNSALIEIANNDPWVDAAASVARVELVSCSSGQVTSTQLSVPIAIPKGTTKSFTLSESPNGRSYLRVMADAQKVVAEKNETNNSWDGMNECIR
jgi:hypothetical protein